jgi:multidrug efflux pump subunit AcrA (membrane-fusion protein)
MNKNDLVSAVADHAGLTKNDAGRAVDAVFASIEGALKSGDEVRIVNDAGTITRVKVTIGLIDGEWVEIKDGLKGDELVVVDIAAGNVASAA